MRKTTSSTTTPAIKPAIPVLPTSSVSKAPPTIAASSSKQQLEDAGKDEKAEPDNVFKEAAQAEVPAPDPIDNLGQDGKHSATSTTSSKKTVPEAPKTLTKPKRQTTLNISISKEDAEKSVFSTKSSGETPSAKVDEARTESTGVPALSQPATPSTILSQSSAPSTARQSQKAIGMGSKVDPGSPGVPLPSTRALSRQPSLTSLNQPGTPVSEKISDNASYTSNPVSRASSPPFGGKVGSAASRHVSKSQQKKERQARAKQLEEASKKEESPSKVEDEVVQAPIIGRKKKSKKVKEMSEVTADSSPSVTRPASSEDRKEFEDRTPQPVQHQDSNKADQDIKTMPKAPSVPVEPELEATVLAQANTNAEDEPMKTFSMTPSAILASLLASGEISQSSVDMFLRPGLGMNARFDHSLDSQPLPSQQDLTTAQLATLDSGRPVGITLDKNNAIVVLPNRRCLRGLTPAQVDRYVELYDSISHCENPAILHHMNVNAGEDSQISQMIDSLMPPYLAYRLDAANGSATSAANAQQQSTDQQPLIPNRFAEQVSQHDPPPLPLSPFPRSVTASSQTGVGNPSGTTTAQTHVPRSSFSSLSVLPSNLNTFNRQSNRSPPGDVGNNKSHGATHRQSATQQQQKQEQMGSSAAGFGNTSIPGGGNGERPITRSVEEAEYRLAAEKKTTEALEKRLNALIRRNKKLLASALG